MPLNSSSADVIVVGAGAAGMMCAFEAGRRGRGVLLLDHGDRPGRKILISGGGRCNFTNTGTRAENFLSENLHFARSALARYSPAEMVGLVEKHGIRYHEKKLGQLFCDDSARRVVTMLESECGEAGVELRCGIRVLEVRRARESDTAVGDSLQRKNARFSVGTSAGRFTCHTVIVATGGLSIPKMGATGIGYEIARGFGHRVIEPRAALVPLALSLRDLANWSDLAGVSVEVVANVSNRAPGVASPGRLPRRPGGSSPAFRENLLLTHRGLSGPAILQISSYWRSGIELSFDLAPGTRVLDHLKGSSAGRDASALLLALKRVLPARFAERWAELWLQDGTNWSNAGLDRIESALHAWTLEPAGTEGFAKAEVTSGGVDTRELDAHTMESRKVPGLHFIGEVVDVTGWLGGYNFQWAWASAAACGRSL